MLRISWDKRRPVTDASRIKKEIFGNVGQLMTVNQAADWFGFVNCSIVLLINFVRRVSPARLQQNQTDQLRQATWSERKKYRDDGVSSSDGQDVRAGDYGRSTGIVDGRLDFVDHVKPSGGVEIGQCRLLAGEVGSIVQKDRTVTPLLYPCTDDQPN